MNTDRISAADLERLMDAALVRSGATAAMAAATARALVAAHSGKCPLFLCLIRPAGEILFVETNERFYVMPSQKLQQAADEMFGEETYYANVDTSLPERTARRWERKGELASAEV